METQVANPMQPMTPNSIPKQYAALGVETGYHPLIPSQLRFFIIGPEGMGKTTFLAGTPRTLILDFEGGAWGIPRPRAARVVVKTGAHLNQVVAQLEADAKAGKRVFDRVGFDTMDQMIEVVGPDLVARYTSDKNPITNITQFGSKGAGYNLLRQACWDYIARVERAGYAWTCIGHLTEKHVTINKVEKVRLRAVLFDTFAAQVKRNCEVFANIYANTEEEVTKETREHQGQKFEVKTGTRTITKTYMDMSAGEVSMGIGTFQGKKRGVPTMRSKIPLPPPMSRKYGWDAFVTEYDKAVNEVKKGELE